MIGDLADGVRENICARVCSRGGCLCVWRRPRAAGFEEVRAMRGVLSRARMRGPSAMKRDPSAMKRDAAPTKRGCHVHCKPSRPLHRQSAAARAMCSACACAHRKASQFDHPKATRPREIRTVHENGVAMHFRPAFLIAARETYD
eukprot:252007-Pleurochrysis_carterae.AAC.2